MKIKIYDFKDTEDQKSRKKNYKDEFIRDYKDKVKAMDQDRIEQEAAECLEGIPDDEQ
jgi:hypothetical protein